MHLHEECHSNKISKSHVTTCMLVYWHNLFLEFSIFISVFIAYFWLPIFYFFMRRKKKSSTCDSAWYLDVSAHIFPKSNEHTYKNSLQNISQAKWNLCVSIKKVLQPTILQLELLIDKI